MSGKRRGPLGARDVDGIGFSVFQYNPACQLIRCIRRKTGDLKIAMEAESPDIGYGEPRILKKFLDVLIVLFDKWGD
jgi:hypothetical protein